MEHNTRVNCILFVDPDRENLDLCRLLFKKYYKVYTADSAEAALEIIEKHEIKVVLAEQYQREHTAIELFKTIVEQHPHTERILITGSIDKQVIVDAVNIGKIFHHAYKPFEHDLLKSIIDKAVEKYDLQRQNNALIIGLKQTNTELGVILERLKAEELKFRDIFNATQDPILIVGKDGIVLEANHLAKGLFALNPHDLGTMSFLKLVHNDFAAKANRFFEVLIQNDSAIFEGLLFTGDNLLKSFETKGQAISFQGKDARLLILRDTTERKETEKKVLQAIIQTEEAERLRFAQELHDGIGPLLSTAKLYLQWMLKPNAKIDKEVALNKIEQTLDETIASVREVSNNLSPNTLLNFGLEAAIKTILDRITDISDINCILKVEIGDRLPFDLEATIFRIVGECINNTVKHANADKITIDIEKREGAILLEYADDGKGFDKENNNIMTKGNGLSNMKSRVMGMGGEIIVESFINQGTKIFCKFFL